MIEDYSQYCSTRKEALKKGQLFYFTGKKCPKGHLSLRYTKIGRCLECGKEASQRQHKGVRRPAEKQEARAKRIIESFNYTYLGQERRGLGQKVHFIYDCGIKEHENKSVTLSNLERAHREKLETIEKNKLTKTKESIKTICGSCNAIQRADDNPAYSIEDLREFAKREFGGNCLSPKYTRSRDIYLWDCSNPFHQPFPQRWDSVKSKKRSWCPECWKERRGKDKRGDIGPVKDAISVWGGKIRKYWWNGKLEVEVECLNGHVWTADGISFKDGRGCKDCKNKGERIVRAFLEHNLGYKFPSSRPDWLQRKTKGSLELDGFNEEHKIAFEYQGPHHKKSDQIERDQYKKSKCEEKNIRLIYIEYEEKVFPLEIWTSLLTDVFKEHGLTSIHGKIEPPVEPIFVSELEELRQLGKQKGAILKSTEYMGETLPHLWDCGVKEHPDFSMSPYRLRKDIWCQK